MELDKTKYYHNVASMQSHINVGFGSDITIRDLANAVSLVTGYFGEIHFDTSMPDGAPRKLMESNKLKAMGWLPKVDLFDGLKKTYQAFLASQYDQRK
jgi:GDP-L-fucose synthase